MSETDYAGTLTLDIQPPEPGAVTLLFKHPVRGSLRQQPEGTEAGTTLSRHSLGQTEHEELNVT